MNKPHLFKHNGVWIIREEVDPKNCCKGCVGRQGSQVCEALPGCRVPADNEYGWIDYIFKEISSLKFLE